VGIDGVTVHLYRAGETTPYRTTVTGGATRTTGVTPFAALELPGNYLFDLLPPGDYWLEFILPPGRIFTPQDATAATDATDSDADTGNGRTIVTTLDPDENDMTWDAGVVPLGSIGDRVWLDVDGDGYQDDTDPGIPNVTITLTYPDGSTVTTVTDANGNYLFEGLLAGQYTVTIDVSTLPPYLRVSYDPDGGAEHMAIYTLGHGEDVRTLDFGYTPQNDSVTPTPELPEPTPAPTSTPTGPVGPGTGIDGVTPTPVLPQPFCGTGCPTFRLYHTDETGDWEIFRLNSADALNRTTDRINLSLGIGEGVDDMAPSLSPNSEWVVFTSNRATAPNQPDNWEIYVAPTAGGDVNAVQRVTWNTTANDTDPVWGPNNWVVFESNRNGNWDLYAVDMTTGIEYRLTDDPADDINAFWSPDGSRLIFQSQRDGQWQIYELTLGSLNVRRLSDGSAIDVDPVYSPDGLRIAFRSYTAADSDSVISLMDSAGRNRRAITSADENATNQVWSPSGALIAYQSDLDGDLDIYVHDVAANSTRKVTDNTIPDYAPAWRCTDDIVIFTSDIAGDPNIYEENARPISDPPVLVETDSDQLTFEPFDDVYPQMNPSEENASREGQTPDGVFGEQTVFLNPQVGRIPPDLSVDGIIRDEWDTINGCASR
jgi:Tol biopolymer transport system component